MSNIDAELVTLANVEEAVLEVKSLFGLTVSEDTVHQEGKGVALQHPRQQQCE